MEGLDKDSTYRFKSLAGLSAKLLLRQFFPSAPDSDFCVVADGTEATGEELMNIGLFISNKPAFGGSIHFRLERV